MIEMQRKERKLRVGDVRRIQAFESNDNNYDDYFNDNPAVRDCGNENLMIKILSSFAILGDSSISLFISFVFLLISIGFAFYLQHTTYSSETVDQQVLLQQQKQQKHLYSTLGPIPSIDPPYIHKIPRRETTNQKNNNDNQLIVPLEIIQAFNKDGAVAVRGLIPTDLLQKLDIESEIFVQQQKGKQQHQRKKKGTQFYITRHNVLFYNTNHSNKNTKNNESIQSLSAFAEVALQTDIPKLAAKLLNLTNDMTLRVIRDIFLAKDTDEYVCGWHVDDMGFWPATPESPGVNAWIALDDMPIENGGGFALAIQSHLAPWTYDAQYATGASTMFPKGGYKNISDMFQQRTGSGTCNLQQSAPHLHQRMEETKRIYNMKRGDVIFHTRWLFHRTIPFNQTYAQKNNDDDLVYRRYSIRYGPGSSIIPPGYGTELSVLWNEENGGRTADEVQQHDGSWYPIAWQQPHSSSSEDSVSLNENIIKDFQDLVRNKIPIAEQIANQRRQEMQPYLKTLAKKQHRSLNPKQ